MATTVKTPWYGSSGFWNGVILVLSGLVVGFPTGAAHDAIAALFALFASGAAIREGLSGKHLQFKSWVNDKNTWNYLAATLVAIVPSIPVGFVQSVGELVSSALGGNWQGILTAVFSVGTMLYFWLRPKPAPVL